MGSHGEQCARQHLPEEVMFVLRPGQEVSG